MPSGKQIYVNWFSIADSLSSFDDDDVEGDFGISWLNKF
jgi:hypothetical protein